MCPVCFRSLVLSLIVLLLKTLFALFGDHWHLLNLFSQVSSPGKALNLYPSNEYEVLPNGSEAHWEVVERILFIYAKLNPGIAYVQGMNEIVGPIYYTFATDLNSQWKGR